ncbi:MAG: coproporphyrinogen III oxidase, partial [Verrucomicrobiota bacterium]
MAEAPEPFPSADEVAEMFRQLQDLLCVGFEGCEPEARFHEDAWERPEGGGGRTRVLADGQLIEKGGVNFSDVRGERLPGSASAARPQLAEAPFRATGVSAWQFLAPAVVVAALLGVVVVTSLNPLSAALAARYDRLEGQRDGREPAQMSVSAGGIWMKQRREGE